MSDTWIDAAIAVRGRSEVAVGLRCAGIDYLHFDARQIGYTISWFAPQTRFFSSAERISIAGVPLQVADQGKASREEYLAYLRGVVQQFDLKVQTYEPIVGIDRLKNDGGFVLTSRPNCGRGAERKYRVRKLILATGGTGSAARAGRERRGIAARRPLFSRPTHVFPQEAADRRRQELRGRGGPPLLQRRGRRRPQLSPSSARSAEHQVLAPAGNQCQHRLWGKIAGHFCTTVALDCARSRGARPLVLPAGDWRSEPLE